MKAKKMMIIAPLLLKLFINGDEIDLSKQKIMLNNSYADAEMMLPDWAEAYHLEVTVDTLSLGSGPGPVTNCDIPGDTDCSGRIDLPDVIMNLQTLSGIMKGGAMK